MPVCKQEGVKFLMHLSSLLKFRFDGDPDHYCNVEYHMQAAIRCFDVRLGMSMYLLLVPYIKCN